MRKRRFEDKSEVVVMCFEDEGIRSPGIELASRSWKRQEEKDGWKEGRKGRKEAGNSKRRGIKEPRRMEENRRIKELLETSNCFTNETAFPQLDCYSLTPRLMLNPKLGKYISENHEATKHVYCRQYFRQ